MLHVKYIFENGGWMFHGCETTSAREAVEAMDAGASIVIQYNTEEDLQRMRENLREEIWQSNMDADERREKAWYS